MSLHQEPRPFSVRRMDQKKGRQAASRRLACTSAESLLAVAPYARKVCRGTLALRIGSTTSSSAGATASEDAPSACESRTICAARAPCPLNRASEVGAKACTLRSFEALTERIVLAMHCRARAFL